MVSPAATQLTNSHRRDLTLVATLTGNQVAPRLRGADPTDIDAWWTTQAPGITDIVAQGFASAAILASRYLVAHGNIEGAEVEPVLVDPVPDQIENALRVTGPVAFKTQLRNSGLSRRRPPHHDPPHHRLRPTAHPRWCPPNGNGNHRPITRHRRVPPGHRPQPLRVLQDAR